MANRLAYWARDFRLIAEKRRATLTELEQVNELIIRRMRTGVLAVDETNRIRVMNESAWFLMGSPPVRAALRCNRCLRAWNRRWTTGRSEPDRRSQAGRARTQPGPGSAQLR